MSKANLDVPELHRTVLACSYQHSRVARPCYTIHRADVAAHRAHKLASHAIPYFSRFVERGAGQETAIWRELHKIDALLVPCRIISFSKHAFYMKHKPVIRFAIGFLSTAGFHKYTV